MISPASLESVYRSTYGKSPYSLHPAVSAQPAAAEPAACGSDQICISAAGSRLQQAARATAVIGALPAASPQHLQELRRQILADAYQVPAAEVSNCMLQRVCGNPEDAQ